MSKKRQKIQTARSTMLCLIYCTYKHWCEKKNKKKLNSSVHATDWTASLNDWIVILGWFFHSYAHFFFCFSFFISFFFVPLTAIPLKQRIFAKEFLAMTKENGNKEWMNSNNNENVCDSSSSTFMFEKNHMFLFWFFLFVSINVVWEGERHKERKRRRKVCKNEIERWKAKSGFFVCHK